MSYKGSCFCGAVEVEVTGEPDVMGYCHCGSCRSWSASPVNAFALWGKDRVRIVAGEDQVTSFAKTSFSERHSCARCGGHLLTRHPTLDVVDVSAATLPGLAFDPALHVHYAETVLPMKDGLPKMKDFPIEFGGSGEVVPE